VLIFLFLSGCVSDTEKPEISEQEIPQTLIIRDLHNVKIHLVDQNNTPIYNAFITANYNSSAHPNNLNTPNNNRGYTDENGNLTFVMRGSVQYNLTVSNLPDRREIFSSITPTAIEYSLQIESTPTQLQTPVPTRTNSWDKNLDESWGYKIGKGICSFIPYVNNALNC
jgi:hypothetical protein